MKNLIYADNAATTKLDIDAYEAMQPYLMDDYGNASQSYSFSRSSKKALKEAREIISDSINANPGDIFFTSGGTESDNWAIKGYIFKNPNSSIITSQIEHHAILNPCHTLEKSGVDVRYIAVDENGLVSLEELERYLHDNSQKNKKTRSLVSIMFANNEIGTVEPIKDIAAISHKYNAVFHTDAVQAIGHVDIDVKKMEIDLLSASAHKFNGPKGVGFLYVRNSECLSPYNEGGAQEFGMRAGTENIAGIIGMAYALRKNADEIEKNKLYLLNLESILEDELKTASIQYRRNGATSHIPGNMSLSFLGIEGEMLMHRLDLMGICVSTGAACDSRKTQLSHVLQAIELDKNYAYGTIRVSLGKFNTEEDVKEIGRSIINVIKES